MFGGNRVLPRAATAAGARAFPGELPLQHPVVDPRRLLTRPWVMALQSILGAKSYAEGAHQKRLDDYPAKDYAPGTRFFETDRTVFYQVRIVSGKSVWVYADGTMRAPLADQPTDLGLNDSGLLLYANDYAHTWRWTGTGWEYAPGDRASGEIAWFTATPGTGWVLCNGGATTRTTAGAGTAAFTTPNLVGAYAKGAAAYTGSVIGATDPVISGGVVSSVADHLHHIGPFSIAGATTGSTVNLGSAVNVANYDHAHPLEADTGGGGAHSHTVSGLGASGGEPAHMDLLPYFRQ